MDRVAYELGIRVRPFIRHGRATTKWQVAVHPTLTSTGKWQKKTVDSETEGWRLATDLVRTLRKNGVVTATHDPKGHDPALREVFTAWLEAQELRAAAGKKKRSSIDTNVAHLAAILTFFPERFRLSQVTETGLERYQAHRRALGRQPETINSEVRTLTQVQAWAVKEGLLARVVSVDPVPQPLKEPTILEIHEYHQLLEHLPKRLRPIVQLLAETGSRRGEVLNLRWQDLDLEAGTARISVREEWTPKTAHSARQLHLSPSLVEALQALPRTSVYVFPGRDDSAPLGSFKRAFRTAVLKAGIQRRVTPKTLRASFATWQAERGTTEAVVQSLLGHVPGSRVTRRHYEMSHRRQMVRAAAAGMWQDLQPKETAA